MIWNAFQIALREIRRNLTRAFLTVLGIIIGVAAVVTMVTLGDGATESVKTQISSLGSNLLVLRPGMGWRAGPGTPRFTMEDAVAIKREIPGVVAAAPIRSGSFSTIFLENARTTSVNGSTTDYFFINKWDIAEGRFFTDAEVQAGEPVGVIGDTVRKELFGEVNPIGQKIRVGNTSIQIIGLLKAKGQVGMGDQDDNLIMPITTVQQRLTGRLTSNDVNMISISAADGTNSDKLIYEINSLMRQRRNLQPNQGNNFNVFDTRQIADTLSASTKTMTMLLATVAGVSLLVGGIGIMNIMLVSVTERTREIGIRLAIGATAHEVLLQFLVEAITLSCIGGLVGLAIALGLCSWLSGLIQVPFIFNMNINLIAFAFSAGIGVLFGFAPARRAAKLDPIEALRHE
ncbi:MAG: ABC transporter permease [Verrucomicrobiota bacterium JB022]|nr:ABC transporter permease [Verrucomicrobiota bacterium JB022]